LIPSLSVTTAPRWTTSGLEPTDAGELLDLMLQRPAWHVGAACRTASDVTNWFPVFAGDAARARRVCGGCPVVDSCASWAIKEGPDLKGIWGGLSERERQRMRKSAA
jgi:WhiB family redox-sensing transcriptional regulator